jgi:hypothetical protein
MIVHHNVESQRWNGRVSQSATCFRVSGQGSFMLSEVCSLPVPCRGVGFRLIPEIKPPKSHEAWTCWNCG